MSYAKATASASSGGIGIFGLMFIIMFALKLGGVIDLSWWIVTSPLWVPAAIVVFMFLVAFGFLLYQEYKK